MKMYAPQNREAPLIQTYAVRRKILFMLHKFISTLFLVYIFLGHTVFGEIVQTSDLNQIELSLQNTTQDTLVIFDVDDVLAMAQDDILQKHNKKFLEHIEHEIKKHLTEKDAQKLWSLILLKRKTKPVDSKMISVISNLQSRGIKVLALTNCGTGPYGHINHIENWRIQELKTLGYNFKKSWPLTKPQFFNHLSPHDPIRLPLFKNGIIFTCNLSKGAVLKAFLDHVIFHPKQIIFIDDKKKHLQSVEEYAKNAGIKFFGFEYRGASPRSHRPLDTKRAQLQFEMLEKDHVWLNDQDADLYLKNNTLEEIAHASRDFD